MDAFVSKHIEQSTMRSHPWTDMESNSNNAYIDFKLHPQLIRTSLEDIMPYKKWAFAEQFFNLVEWINGQSSLLESNDCAFNMIQKNDDRQYPFPMKCSGRLMILFRDITENCQEKSIDWLMTQLLNSISIIKPNFKGGAIAISQSPTCYLTLSDAVDQGGIGYQVTLNFFAYGKNERRCYESMVTVLGIAQMSLEAVNKSIKHGDIEVIYQ